MAIKTISQTGTNHTAAVDAAVAGLVSGDILDLQGFLYVYTGAGGLNLPANVTVRGEGGGFDLRLGSATLLMFNPRGTITTLTVAGSAISAGTTLLTSIPGLTAADVWNYLFLGAANEVAATYKVGEFVQIDSISGTNVTLESRVKLSYVTPTTVSLVNLKQGIVFDQVRFVGDPSKQQRGVQGEYLLNGTIDVIGLNMGHFTAALLRCVQCQCSARGGNPGINTDNGLDYLIVYGDGNRQCEFYGNGHSVRHVIASGGTRGVDFDCVAEAIGSSLKDSCFDSHPGQMDAVVRATVASVRHGGTFSLQPVGLMWQGGGSLKAEVVVNEYDTSAAIIQLLQNTVDSVDIKVIAKGANPDETTGATNGLDVQVKKPGGSITSFVAEVVANDLSRSISRGFNFDTSGSAAGLVVEKVKATVVAVAKAYGASIICRSGHSIVTSELSGLVSGLTAGAHGFAAFKLAGGTYGYHKAVNCHVNGPATTIGVRADAISRSLAVGNSLIGVGGATITTYAVLGFTNQFGNDYT
jgi:hypothetical protein